MQPVGHRQKQVELREGEAERGEGAGVEVQPIRVKANKAKRTKFGLPFHFMPLPLCFWPSIVEEHHEQFGLCNHPIHEREA
jgi:hypothetical protein